MEKNVENTFLVSEIKILIDQSKQKLAVAVNATMSELYWQIGKRIKESILGNERASYGKSILKNLSIVLTQSGSYLF